MTKDESLGNVFEEEEQEFLDKLELFVDDSYGIYIPQVGLRKLDPSSIVDYEQYKDDIDVILNEGPDYEHYWDVWAYLLDNLILEGLSGKFYRLYQDGDLFVYEIDEI